MVPAGNGIFRMFYDTHSSGVHVRVKILDDKRKIIFETEEENEKQSSQAIFLMLDEPDSDEPFIIELEYSFSKKSSRLII